MIWTDGDIRIDGISTQDMSREEVHGLFGMVLQDTWMFEGTVRENLVYNRTGVIGRDSWSAPAAPAASITSSRRSRTGLTRS